MTEKRFFLMRKFLRKDKFHDIICHRFMDSKETEKTLNRLYGKYSSLKIENEQLKGALKELKEIGDYQEMRIQELYGMNSLIEDEIDKKIAVLTDAKIKSFQNEDEELLGKIKFSIQVLRELKEVILE